MSKLNKSRHIEEQESFDRKDQENLEIFFKKYEMSPIFNGIDEIIRRNRQIENAALRHYLFLDKLVLLMDIFIMATNEMESNKTKKIVKRYIKTVQNEILEICKWINKTQNFSANNQ